MGDHDTLECYLGEVLVGKVVPRVFATGTSYVVQHNAPQIAHLHTGVYPREECKNILVHLVPVECRQLLKWVTIPLKLVTPNKSPSPWIDPVANQYREHIRRIEDETF